MRLIDVIFFVIAKYWKQQTSKLRKRVYTMQWNTMQL